MASVSSGVRARRAGFAYHALPGLIWIGLAALYAGVTGWGARTHPVITVVVDGALFLAAALCCAVAVMAAEDRWNDFRRQKRLAAICAILLAGSLAAGLAAGWWAGA